MARLDLWCLAETTLLLQLRALITERRWLPCFVVDMRLEHSTYNIDVEYMSFQITGKKEWQQTK